MSYSFDHRVIEYVQQLATTTAKDCPSCAGCVAAAGNLLPAYAQQWCERLWTQGQCQKQMWQWLQQERLQLLLAAVQRQLQVSEGEYK